MEVAVCYSAFFKDIGAGLVLLLSLVSIVATSKSRPGGGALLNSPGYGDPLRVYKALISSDCAPEGPINDFPVKIKGFRIIAPIKMTFLDAGFPVEMVDGSGVQGYDRDGIVRYCDRVLGGNEISKQWDYSCSDNGQPVCRIQVKFIDSTPQDPNGDNKRAKPSEPINLEDPAQDQPYR